ncbi:hypothetical protein NF27_DT01470 [Candidatus Jidaibacter acanthamoeba]|uniref:Uncharacterized protein n=1 Tax=Candidatus Jidaibacter acanthamoebae TaxID=86105 RepID=A0A0C1QMV0_9RICK|nr:hypothetical protein [Candidatus Jidaibacter acanthamoeba]KIE05373.1 hypothetical protein NF27_DT01470 [Candidatus Jidaibacter acanthamoeba]
MQQMLVKDFHKLIKVLNTTVTNIVKNKTDLPAGLINDLLKLEAVELLNYSEVSAYAQGIISSADAKNPSAQLVSSLASILGKVTTDSQFAKENNTIIEETDQLIKYISEHSLKISSSLRSSLRSNFQNPTNEHEQGFLEKINFKFTSAGFNIAEIAEGLMMAYFAYKGAIPFGKAGIAVFGAKALFKAFEPLEYVKNDGFFSYGNNISPYEEQDQHCINDDQHCYLTPEAKGQDEL